MKRFLISLTIVSIFSAAVFFIGWTQLRIKPDCFGIVISKTSGIDEKPVMNGEFSWHWELLLPTNTTLKTFSIEPVNVTKTNSGELPSGGLYADLYNSSERFNYRFVYSMSLTVSPDNVIQLLKENKISDNDDLAEYLSIAADSVAQMATDFFLSHLYEDPAFRPESVRRDELYRALKIYEDFPYIDLAAFAVTEAVFPDYGLYKQLQNQGNLIIKDYKTQDGSAETNENNTEITTSASSNNDIADTADPSSDMYGQL